MNVGLLDAIGLRFLLSMMMQMRNQLVNTQKSASLVSELHISWRKGKAKTIFL